MLAACNHANCSIVTNLTQTLDFTDPVRPRVEQVLETLVSFFAPLVEDAPLIDEATLEKCDVSVRRKLRQAADDGTEDGTLSAAEVAEARRLGRLQTPPCRP